MRVTTTAPVGLVCCFVLLACGTASADIYKWYDQNGTAFFTDDLSTVPAQRQKEAKRLKEERPPRTIIQTLPETPGPGPGVTAPLAPSKPEGQVQGDNNSQGQSTADPHTAWQKRISKARQELEELKAEREKAEEQRLAMIRQVRVQGGPVDNALYDKLAAQISGLDQRIRDKEYEISTTIPDEARRAGVPPSVLSP